MSHYNAISNCCVVNMDPNGALMSETAMTADEIWTDLLSVLLLNLLTLSQNFLFIKVFN